MLKKGIFFVAATLLSQLALAQITVYVENDSNIYEIFLTDKDLDVSTYDPAPKNSIAVDSIDLFTVYNSLPTIARLIDLEYSFDPRGFSPRCHFRFVALKDYRTGYFVPQPIIEDSEGGSFNDRAICSANLDAFNLVTGEAFISLSINRRKF